MFSKIRRKEERGEGGGVLGGGVINLVRVGFLSQHRQTKIL